MRANRSGWSSVVWRGVAAGSSSPYHMMCVGLLWSVVVCYTMRLQGISVDKRR